MFLKDIEGKIYHGIFVAVHSESNEELAIVLTPEEKVIAMTKEDFNKKLQQCNKDGNIKF